MDKIVELKKLLWILDSKHNVSIPQTKENIDYIADEIVKLFYQPDVAGSPNQLEPVLAEIEHINDLGKSKWYEVVYFDENWQSYAGSKTFQDGEKVIRWKHVKDCL